MGKKPSLKAWNLVFEAGLGVTVLLGMLALWLSMDDAEEIRSADSKRRDGSQLGHRICNRSLYPSPWELRSDQLTILVNGFMEARLPLLQSSLRMYSSSPAVHSIFVLWGNTSTPDSVLPEFETLGAPIYMIRQPSTSLNDRFLPRGGVKTKAVMICDDDITVDSSNLEFALQVWRENQDRIVGFFPRAHSYSLDSQSWIYTKNERKYSIMLTKIMILATQFLYRYSCEMPEGVKAFVDQGMNCEDIAMNFLVSNLSGSGPLLVEGQPRDWGDSRNSGAEELTSMGLSARADHRKDRGDCIRAFQGLWNGMPLRFSYAKAVRNVDEQVKCDKFGQLIECDLSATSLRDARRHAGHHLTKRTSQYAYVTHLLSKDNFYAALVWAQALRNSGTLHDLVLLLDAQHSGVDKVNETLTQHFDVIKQVQHRVAKLSAWQLRDYERVVFMDLNLLCLGNLDFLFALREFAAAPLTRTLREFHTGLLVLQPSEATFTEIVRLQRLWKGEHRLLNGFFQDWFFMDVEHRLPLRLNMPLQLSSFAPNGSESKATLPGVLQYPKRELLSMQTTWMHREGSNQTKLPFRHEENKTGCFGMWLELLAALRSNKYQPLDDDQISHLSWKPPNTTFSWPPKLPKPKTLNSKPPHAPLRKAFATVLTSVDDLAYVGGWITTFNRFHVSTPRHKSLLLVHKTVNPQAWQPLEPLFDSVVVADTLLHLWNQTGYQKLVYVDPRSIFLSNCDFLLEMKAFAAAPDFVLPDTFSLQVMVIQPDHRRFLELSRRYRSSMAPFLNEYYSFWYPSSPKHRIEAIFNAEGSDFQNDLEMDWKIFSFYSSSPFRDPGSDAAIIWHKYVCSVHSPPVDLVSSFLNLCNFKPL